MIRAVFGVINLVMFSQGGGGECCTRNQRGGVWKTVIKLETSSFRDVVLFPTKVSHGWLPSTYRRSVGHVSRARLSLAACTGKRLPRTSFSDFFSSPVLALWEAIPKTVLSFDSPQKWLRLLLWLGAPGSPAWRTQNGQRHGLWQPTDTSTLLPGFPGVSHLSPVPYFLYTTVSSSVNWG